MIGRLVRSVESAFIVIIAAAAAAGEGGDATAAIDSGSKLAVSSRRCRSHIVALTADTAHVLVGLLHRTTTSCLDARTHVAIYVVVCTLNDCYVANDWSCNVLTELRSSV